jgi:hypothetical protein
MIPVEDVTRITSKSELKKGVQADVKSHITPVYAQSENCCDHCYASLLNCCRKTRDCLCYCCQKETKIAPYVRNETIIHDADPNKFTSYKEEHLPLPEVKENCCTRCCNKFRCWCCRKKMLVDLIKRTNTKAEKQAQRVITITVEYTKYSNPDSASNARLLSEEEQAAYYKRIFQPNTPLKFYLVNNTEFDPRNFELKRKQADVLCLTVMHLKAMKNRYPSEDQLGKILDQSHTTTFGDVFNEPILQLPVDPKTAAISQEASQRLAIKQQPPTTSKYDEDANED